MATYDFPSNISPQESTFRLRHAVAVAESPFTYEQQVFQHTGARWEAEITLPPLTHDQAKSFQAFLAKLKGRTNTFTFGNPLHDESFNVTTTAATAIRDTSIAVSGDAVPAGNYLQLGSYIYIVTDDFSAGTGNLSIEPPIREVVSSGTALNFSNPKSTWRMATNDLGWSIDRIGHYSFTFACTEAL